MIADFLHRIATKLVRTLGFNVLPLVLCLIFVFISSLCDFERCLFLHLRRLEGYKKFKFDR